MFGGIRLKVSYSYERTCFAYVSQKYCTNNEQAQCVQVLYKDKQFLFWLVFNSNTQEGLLACNPAYCRLLGLTEGCDVFVSPHTNTKVLDELHIDADSPEDQEILEHNAELLQFRILDQLRVVVANQKAMVWISVALPIIFTPRDTGMLVNHSRIFVKIDAFNSISSKLEHSEQISKEKEIKFKNIGIMNDEILKPYLNLPKKLVLRAIPIDSDGKKNLIHPYTVFIHEDLIENKYKEMLVILATMRNIPSILKENADGDEEKASNEINDICVEIVPIDNVVFRSLCREVYNRNIPTVLIPKSLNAIINAENGRKIIFTIIGDKVVQPEHIDILIYSEQNQSEIDVVEKFKNCVIENTHSGKKFLINNGIVKQNTQITDGHLQFKLKPDSLKYTMLNSESFRHCTIAAKCQNTTNLVLTKPIASLDYDSKNYCKTMKSLNYLVEQVVSHLYFEIHREATFKAASEIKSNVLITGSSGTGKSSLCYMVQREMTVWSHVLHCRSLRGRRDLPEVLGRVILMCQEHSPALLICDDLDALVPPELEGVSPQDIAYYQRLAVVIKHLLQTCSGVCVLMTSLSLKSLHPTLRHFTGKPLFTAHFNMPELTQEDRVIFLKHLINDKLQREFLVDDEDVIRLCADTAGYTIRDITDYLTQKIFKAVKKKRANPADLKTRLIEETAKDTEKATAFDIWGPVGGLHDVKRDLTESIFWPMMYPALYPSQSCGILLYGPPGTGKSLIGSCLARLAGVTMLLVKGPELLSKYIGQSEKAVRDIFDKAEAQKPCILFFDEFDSLAPKRGHDSTGVTDRVVNQLLARLDGAEGGASGPVIAATSRPDLIDPALLRAGRISTHIYTPLPDQRERLEVLQTMSSSVELDDAVDLDAVARQTEGFSPADLKSLLVTAQLAALEIHLQSKEDKNPEAVVVLPQHVQGALSDTKPSLSDQQRAFYDIVYRRFRGEPLTPKQRNSMYQQQRVTLA